MKILFVENHAIFVKEVCRLFLSSHEVTVVPNLSGARSALATNTFDLVLVDYDLDDGKGDELVRELQQSKPQLRAVAVSAHDAGNAALRKAGAVATCGKMEFDRIGKVIERLG